MSNILIEQKNSPYTYIYVSREYYDGKCLNENRLGIGKSKDPYKRLKDHNSSSSKISVEVKFELLYKTKEQDTFFHNLLKNKGYKQIKKEIFEGTENRPLTLTEVKSLIESYSIDGPWIFKNNQFIKLESNKQFNKTSFKIKTKIEEPKTLDEQWNLDLNKFKIDCLSKGYFIQSFILLINTYVGCVVKNLNLFLGVEFISLATHSIAILVFYFHFKNDWINKHFSN